MRILHTADWHLGRTLYDKTRYAEFKHFLDWLIETIRERSIDVLLVAGDVFDTIAPSYRAQELYYDFLSQLAKTGCRHGVITAGNHDSPTFLEAPKRLLQAMDIHILGNVTDPIDREVLLLRDADGKPELIVCAVPYLRDRDIRKSDAAESLETKEIKLREGIANHYAQVADIAVRMRDSLGLPIPILAMGHLYTAGGETIEGDGVRKLYVGNLAHVESSIFPNCFDYVALGHLHVPQTVNGSEIIRFSGSPIPMGFGEAQQQKYVNLIEWADNRLEVDLIPVPQTQRLESIQGDWPHIESRLEELKHSSASIWLEVSYRGAEPIANLREKIDEIIDGTLLECLCVSDDRNAQTILKNGDFSKTLEELQPIDIFQRCLELNQVPEDKRKDLVLAYEEILSQVQESVPHVDQ
jgi:exonuclease SbcD